MKMNENLNDFFKLGSYYKERKKKEKRVFMKRKLIIDGNAVYEIDENCMLKNRVDKEKEKKDREKIRSEKAGH